MSEMQKSSDWPSWRYRAAENEQGWEGQIFDKAEDVPKGEGWVDNPSKVKKAVVLHHARKKAHDAESDD